MPDMMDRDARDWIIDALDNDPEALSDGIKTLFNCHHAEIHPDGDVWIADPQRGHWLHDDDLAVVAKALEAGDI